MRSNLIHIGLFLLGSALLLGCSTNNVRKIGTQTSSSQQPATNTTFADGVARITISELQEKIKSNEVFIVDVRNQASFDVGHIPGSKLIPEGEILNHVGELPKNKLIVTYCS
jgi:3-mercaptopyruvate sulfurtransferase SseA